MYSKHAMKGIILAGGNGTRLNPLTLVTNKHLLPVYDKPIIYYAVEKLVEAGIDRVMIVSSPHHLNDFVSLLGSGQAFVSKKTGKQIQIVYGIQNKPSGLTDGLYIAKDYVGNDNCMLMLGDNIFLDTFSKEIKSFKDGAFIFLKKVPDPERFGVAEIDKDNNVLRVDEKPKKPKSNLAVVGAYIFDNTVFKKMIGQKPSARGEYEITYVINKYIKENKLKARILENEWFDVGTFDSLLNASAYMQKHLKK